MVTVLNNLTLGGLSGHNISNFDVKVEGWINTQVIFKQLLEMTRLAGTSTGRRDIPSRRPIGIDSTPDEVLTWYCTFTDQDIMKPEDGWYLVQSIKHGADARRPRWFVSLNLLFLGNVNEKTKGYVAKNLETVTNDWDI